MKMQPRIKDKYAQMELAETPPNPNIFIRRLMIGLGFCKTVFFLSMALN